MANFPTTWAGIMLMMIGLVLVLVYYLAEYGAFVIVIGAVLIMVGLLLPTRPHLQDIMVDSPSASEDDDELNDLAETERPE